MKKIKKYLLLAICLFLCFAAFHGAMSVQEVEADEIIRIGIMKFLNRASGLSNQQAEAITDIFTRMLSKSRVIAIIERDRLDSIGREHKLNMSGLVDTGTAVEIGRIAGCQYMLLGSVTQFTKNVTNQKFAFINETKLYYPWQKLVQPHAPIHNSISAKIFSIVNQILLVLKVKL